MSHHTTYSHARNNLATLYNQAINDRETIVIERRGFAPVALIALDELEDLQTTAHLLSSPRNAQRLLSALNRALSDQGDTQTTIELCTRGWSCRKRKNQRIILSKIVQTKNVLQYSNLNFVKTLNIGLKKIVKRALRVMKLIEEILRDPFVGTGKPEPLKYLGSGVWSRRITQEHRLTYLVRDKRIDFLQCRCHY